MRLQTKALYNLLRLNAFQDPSVQVEKWQVDDLRAFSSSQLFQKLLDLDVPLTKEEFLAIAESVDTPEDLTEILLDDMENMKIHDQIYLILFELWRRFLPERQTLSIFCDELDRQIFLYDQGELDSDENIQDALANLEDILDENADIGAEPTKVFQSLTEYLANDLESFLYDYISEQMDAGYEFFAGELLDGFYPYMSDLRWFDFLRARLAAQKDINEANEILALILKELVEEPDLDLQIEILRFMVQAGDGQLFHSLVDSTLPYLQTEEDFQELMEIVAEFYRRLDKEDLEAAIEKIMVKRQKRPLSSQLQSQDPDLKTFSKLIEKVYKLI